VSVVLAALLLIRIVVPSLALAYQVVRPLSAGTTARESFEVAGALGRMGIRPGDKVAIIGWGSSADGAFWARLARLRIVAEIPQGAGFYEGQKFWQAPDTTKIQALQAVALTGAKIVVAPLPEFIRQPRWQRLGDTNYYAFSLDSLTKPPVSGPRSSGVQATSIKRRA
jgi:hypothetical protein